MFKSFITRLLIVVQVYSVFFQNFLWASDGGVVVDRHPSTYHYQPKEQSVTHDKKIEPPLQHYYRLWQALSDLKSPSLSFEKPYQPEGWDDRYQLLFAFQHEDSPNIFRLPSDKNFVSHEGAELLQSIYGTSGWFCQFNNHDKALSLTYCPKKTTLISFLLEPNGSIRISTLSAQQAFFYTTGILSLVFDDDASVTPELTVAAPVVRTETPFHANILNIFTQKYVNSGSYHLQQGVIQAAETINTAGIYASRALSFLGHNILENNNSTLQAGQITIDAKNIKNFLGKILSNQRVAIRSQYVANSKGLIRSLEELDLRAVGQMDLGNIETLGDVLLTEGQFTMSLETAIGNADETVGNAIQKLIIETNPTLKDHSLELLGTIKATFFQAPKNTILKERVTIKEIKTGRGIKVTFAPGQVQQLTGYLQDYPLISDYLNSLNRLEWLITSEHEVLPDDIQMSGQLVIKAAPGSVIPRWLIKKHAHAELGLELMLPDSDIVMGMGDGSLYPEWIADQGKVQIIAKTFDQKSGIILAKKGGAIQVQGKVKIGEAYDTLKEFFEGVSSERQVVGKKSAALGAGDYFFVKSYLDDITFCLSRIELARFSFDAKGSIAFLSSKIKTKGSGRFQGEHLRLSPDVNYLPTIRGIPRLIKDVTSVYVDGDLELDISDLIEVIGSFGVASGKVHNLKAPRQPLSAQDITESYTWRGYNCCVGTGTNVGLGKGICQHHKTLRVFSAGLFSSNQIILPAHKLILQGILSAPIVEISTNHLQMGIFQNRAPHLVTLNDTIHDLSRYIGFSPFYATNSDPLGPAIIHRLFRMEYPPSVYYHNGRFAYVPLPGKRLRYDHPIVANALAEALVSNLQESYLNPHESFENNYLFACLNGVNALEKLCKKRPELVDKEHANLLLQEDKNSVIVKAKHAEIIADRFDNQPIILHVLGEDNEYTPILHLPTSVAHRSLSRSEVKILSRERLTIKPLNTYERSSIIATGVTLDSGKDGKTEIFTDDNVFAPHRWQTTSYERQKHQTNIITEEHLQKTFIGGKQTIKGKQQHFEGTHLLLDGDSIITGDELISIEPAYRFTTTQSHGSSRNFLGGKSVYQANSLEQMPELFIAKGKTGDEQLTLLSKEKVALIAPNLLVKAAVETKDFELKLAHHLKQQSSFKHEENPIINTTTTMMQYHDVVIPGKMSKGLEVKVSEGGKAIIEYPLGQDYPNLTLDPNAIIEKSIVADVHEESIREKITPGVGTMGALGLAGNLFGGFAFTGLMGQMGVSVTTLDITGKLAFSLAKAASSFIGTSLFQGMALGKINFNPRGLGVALATTALIGSSPELSSEMSFGEVIGSQVLHELKTLPQHTLIHSTIGGKKLEEAFKSSLRQGIGHAVGASLAHQIGLLYKGEDKIDYVSHKLAHFIGGATTGTILNNDPLGGGLGAAFAEMSMEAMVDAEKEGKAIFKENPNLSPKEFSVLFQERMVTRRYFSQVIGGFMGVLGGGKDFDVASNTAAIALDYNMLELLNRLGQIAYTDKQREAEKLKREQQKHIVEQEQDEDIDDLGYFSDTGLETLSLKDFISGERLQKDLPPNEIRKREYNRKKHYKALRKFFKDPPSDNDEETCLQKNIIQPVVKSQFVQKLGQRLGEKKDKSQQYWQVFKDNPSLKEFSLKHTLRHGTFEALDLVGTGVDYAKAYIRRTLRATGVPKDVAQDIATSLEIGTCFMGGASTAKNLPKLVKNKISIKKTFKVDDVSKSSLRNAKNLSNKSSLAEKTINDYLGNFGMVIKNTDGDIIIMNNYKKIRFDITNPHGDKPHFHIEHKNPQGKWEDAGEKHRYYFKENE